MSTINQENVEAILRSYQLVGPIHEIIKDQNGRTLSGRHREQVDQAWPTRTIEVKDAFEREMIIYLSNVQRFISEEEHKFRLNRIAMEYWVKMNKEKPFPEQKVAISIMDLLAPEQGHKVYSRRRIYEFLEDRWKEPGKADAGALGGAKTAANLAAKKAKETIEKLEVRGIGEKDKPSVMEGCLCPTCPNQKMCY